MNNVIDVLKARGFIEALTDEEVHKLVEKPQKVYCGFDPTSDSLHLGNLVAIMGLAWFQRCGHTPVALIGGATGMVGDPSGKSHERSLLDAAAVDRNLIGIKKNLETVLDWDHPTAKPVILNNYDWFKEFSLIDFLRDVGKYFRIGSMLGKESVRARLQSEEGISFTEFSYQLLQGYDFLHLFQEEDVRIQLGGSDQWGNITAGIDLVRRVHGESTYGVTFPLLTRSDGKKFGKTESGAVWLSAGSLSPYEFYQYLYRIPDADVIHLMKMLTFMDLSEIAEYEKMLESSDIPTNEAQKRLAEEVTRIIHGEQGVKLAQTVTEGVKPGSQTNLDVATLESIAEHTPSKTISRDEVCNGKLIDLFVKVGLQNSKGDARRLIRNGGAYLNNSKIEDENFVMDQKLLVEGRLLLLGVGKKKKMVVRVVD